ncbi:transposase [Streptomyces chartreusis]|uniref:transposase n=1 Tax=Streptomyces chartreusis TaxID=1969 RepID=UPI0036D8374D
MTGVITASEPSWIGPFSGLSPRCFGKLVTALRREGADAVGRGRPWSLPLEDRVLLVAAYWRTNLTMRQLALLFGISKSAADRIIDHRGPLMSLRPRRRFSKDTVLIVDGTLVPTRDHEVAEQSKNYRYSTNHQIVIDADSRLVVVVGRPLPGNRNDCKAWELSGAKDAVGRTTVIADGGYRGTGLVIPHRRARGQTELPSWKEDHNASHRKVRARVEHAFARMKGWKILRDCRLKGDGVHYAMLGIARLHNLALTGYRLVPLVSPAPQPVEDRLRDNL